MVKEGVLRDFYYAISVDIANEGGFGLAIDDFGTGYSSLQCLKHLPLQRIKKEDEIIVDTAIT
jgi:EAL domain-containing protein (putative c-di-GMP-specific phosphodiesterase class I)